MRKDFSLNLDFGDRTWRYLVFSEVFSGISTGVHAKINQVMQPEFLPYESTLKIIKR